MLLIVDATQHLAYCRHHSKCFICTYICYFHESVSVSVIAISWTVARQVPLSTGFSRQEYWNGLPYPPPGDLLDPGIKPTSLTTPALTGRFFTTSATWEAPKKIPTQGSNLCLLLCRQILYCCATPFCSNGSFT